MLLRSPPSGGVLRVWSGATLSTHPKGRHTSPPFGKRYVKARDLRPPASAGGPCHTSPEGSPTYPPPQGPRLAGPRAVCHRL